MSELLPALETATQQAQARLMTTSLAQKALTGQLQREEYISFLQHMYHFVKHTPRVLASAAGRMDATYDGVRHWLLGHSHEEDGHDQMILHDLKVVGEDVGAVQHTSPSPACEALVGYTYYVALVDNPVGILGESVVVEGVSAAMSTHVAQMLGNGTDVPQNAATFLTAHGVADHDHAGEARHVLAKYVAGDAGAEAAVLQCARVISELYPAFFGSML